MRTAKVRGHGVGPSGAQGCGCGRQGELQARGRAWLVGCVGPGGAGGGYSVGEAGEEWGTCALGTPGPRKGPTSQPNRLPSVPTGLGMTLRYVRGANTLLPAPSQCPAFLRPGLALVTRQPRHWRAPTLQAGMDRKLLMSPSRQQQLSKFQLVAGSQRVVETIHHEQGLGDEKAHVGVCECVRVCVEVSVPACESAYAPVRVIMGIGVSSCM